MSGVTLNFGPSNPARLPFQKRANRQLRLLEHLLKQFAAGAVKDEVLPLVLQMIREADAVLLTTIEANLNSIVEVGGQLYLNGQPLDSRQLLGIAPAQANAQPAQIGTPAPPQPAQIGTPSPALSPEDAALLQAAKSWVATSGQSQTEFVRDYGALFADMAQRSPSARRDIRLFVGRLIRRERGLQFDNSGTGRLELEDLLEVEDVYDALVQQSHGSRTVFADLKRQVLQLITSGGGMVSKATHDASVKALRDFITGLASRRKSVKLSTGVVGTANAEVIAISGVPGFNDLHPDSVARLADPTKIA